MHQEYQNKKYYILNYKTLMDLFILIYIHYQSKVFGNPQNFPFLILKVFLFYFLSHIKYKLNTKTFHQNDHL